MSDISRWQVAGGPRSRLQSSLSCVQMAGSDTFRVNGGRWQVAGGRWQVAGGKWQVAGGMWQLAGGRWQVASSSWQLAAGSWQVDVKPSFESLKV